MNNSHRHLLFVCKAKDPLLLHLLYEWEDWATGGGRSQTWWELWDQQARTTSLQQNATPACCNLQGVLWIRKLLFTQQNQILFCDVATESYVSSALEMGGTLI